MQISALSVEQALASLASSAGGLSEGEAARRLREFGANRVEEIERVPLWRRLAREFVHLFALVLWLAAGLAFFAEHAEPGGGMAELGIAILSVILINGAFSFWQEYRAERALAALRNLLPEQVKVVRESAVKPIEAAGLVPGDVILLEEGDRVPADARLIEAVGVRLNLATLTGESLPKARRAEPDPEASPPAARCLVLAGTDMISGQARAVVYATGMRTEFGRIAHLSQSTGDPPSPLQREVARLSRVIALLATGLGVVFFVVGQAIGMPFWANLMFAVGIIVANVPEGLLPTLTLALAMATQRMARRNALVRHLPVIEALGCTTVIVSDKTGTLTDNRMSVRRLWHPGTAASPHALAAMAHCHNVRRAVRDGRETLLGDPMEIALVEHAARAGAPALEVRGEIPFDHERRRMAVIADGPDGATLYCKGALESLLQVAQGVEAADGTRRLDSEARAELLSAQEAMAAEGLRVLALGDRRLAEGEPASETGLILCGLAGLEDPPRPEVAPAIARCREAGVRVIMVTGDHPHTALAIGREIGLLRESHPAVLRGEQLARMSASQLQLALEAPEILFARVSAEQKMRIVEALKAKGEIVAATGDGVNDAPALKSAHIGIAMGKSGTDVAREAADLVLLDDNFATIVNAIEEGRAVYANIRKFLTYILTSNIPEIIPYLAFVLFRIPLPLTVVQILAVDLGTDMLPALALGAERPDPEVMRVPPRPRSQRLLDAGLLLRAYAFLGVLEACAALAAFFHVLGEAGWVYGHRLAQADPLYLQATTACLGAIVVTQIVNLLLCRHPSRPLFGPGFFDNRLLWWAIVSEFALILLIVYTPIGNRLVGTAPLPLEAWLVAVPWAVAMLALEEARKWIARRINRPAPGSVPRA